MSIQKKSLISTLKTTKKANAAKDTFEAAPASGKLPGKLTARIPGKLTARIPGKLTARIPGKLT